MAPLEVSESPEPVDVPVDENAPTVRIYPSVDVIPHNATSFRYEWSEEMGLVPPTLSIRVAQGEVVDRPLKRLAWEGSMRVALIELQNLKVDTDYVFTLQGFESAMGYVAAPIEQRFRVGSPDFVPPDAAKLRVEGTIEPGGTAPMRVEFPEAVAPASLGALTALAGGGPWAGAWRLEEGESVAVFEPSEPWPDGKPIHVSIGAGVVDLAGNEAVNVPSHMLSPKRAP